MASGLIVTATVENGTQMGKAKKASFRLEESKGSPKAAVVSWIQIGKLSPEDTWGRYKVHTFGWSSASSVTLHS